jgi:hypothetical protein
MDTIVVVTYNIILFKHKIAMANYILTHTVLIYYALVEKGGGFNHFKWLLSSLKIKIKIIDTIYFPEYCSEYPIKIPKYHLEYLL